MNEQVEQVLQKIRFIEQDIELHKNILVSLSEGKEDEIEKTIRKIVTMKERVMELKQSIAELDPDMHSHIMKLEESTKQFQELTAGRTLQQVITLEDGGECAINLVDGTRLECLVKALDDKGNWIVMTLEGDVNEFDPEKVMDF